MNKSRFEGEVKNSLIVKVLCPKALKEHTLLNRLLYLAVDK